MKTLLSPTTAKTLFAARQEEVQHIIIGTIENTPRVFPRIMIILSKMNFTVQYYKTSPRAEDAFLNMTIIVTGDASRLPQTCKQIGRLIDVMEVSVGVGHGG